SINNVKELTKIRSGQPAILELSFEDLTILDTGDRSQRKPEGITASVEWHLGPSNESVNRKNRISVNFLQNKGERRIQRHPLLAQASGSPTHVSVSICACASLV
ncbi:hypothetical protein, partial [Sphingobium chungbukense]|uniref:hypothetical protein n=1 Tax=Sphingobium chungbukense TaxID=56193 RepID=UPI001E3FED9B